MAYYGESTTKYVISGSDLRNLFRANITGIDKIKQNLISFLNTPKGSRFFNPDYGVNLGNLVFEPNDFIMINSMKKFLSDSFNKYFPELLVQDLSIETSEDALSVRVFLRFYTNSSYESGDITFIIDKG